MKSSSSRAEHGLRAGGVGECGLGDVMIPLSYQAFDCLWHCVKTLAIEANKGEVERGLGVMRDQLEAWARRLLDNLLAQRRPHHVTTPASYVDIAPRLYRVCFLLVSESALHTVAGRKRGSSRPARRSCSRRYERSASPEGPQSEMDEPATISLC